jgi:hypothetical protein
MRLRAWWGLAGATHCTLFPRRVVENSFSLPDPDADIPFDVGRFYYAVRKYSDSLRMYMLSWKCVGDRCTRVVRFRRDFFCVAQNGPHYITCHNIGLCQYGLGQVVLSLMRWVSWCPCM